MINYTLTTYENWSANKIFEVRHTSCIGEKFVVNIDNGECSCRKWGLTGIPCSHAIAAMKFLNLDGADYIPVYFRKSTYEEIYSSIIYPINGMHMWEETGFTDVLPPSKRALPGKPKKNRRLEA